MKKIYYRIFAFSMALYFFFGSPMLCYVEAKKYEGWRDCLWNEDATKMENLAAWGKLVVATADVIVAPNVMTGLVASLESVDFYNFMTSDLGIDPETEEGEDALKNLVVYDDKSQEFTISNSFNNSMHTYITNYLEKETGYVVIPTLKYEDVDISYFGSKQGREYLRSFVENIDTPYFITFGRTSNPVSVDGICYVLRGGYNMIPHSFSGNFDFNSWESAYTGKVLGSTGRNSALMPLNDDWSYPTSYTELFYCFAHFNFDCKECSKYTDNAYCHFDKGFISACSHETTTSGFKDMICPYDLYPDKSSNYHSMLVSNDGTPVKVWKSIDSFKRYDIGQQPYYTSEAWNNYDYSQDNSQTISTSTVDNSIKDSNNNTTYNEIVNNTTNGMTEKEVADLVETILKNQNNGNGNGNGGNGTGSGGSGSGSGLSDLLAGIGSLFDFFASLIGNIISMISNFLTTLIDSLGTFTSIFDGFSEFLSSAFGFIPKEAIAVIISGVTAIVVLAIIKFLKG